MFTLTLYLAAGLCLLISFVKDKKKTAMALRKAWGSFENLLPQFSAILLVIGFMLAVVTPETISALLGKESGWLGMAMAAVAGSFTLIPGFVVFPLAAALHQSGAGLVQLALFVSTLMGVGIVTLPVEVETFGLRVSLTRNILNLALAFAVAMAVGAIIQ